ncbi:MAG: universal stress protein [Syntrophales bacterium]|nr:universal stress protein [Syntrophales bacterium]
MIPKIKRVLYATDLSENSTYAFRYAVNTAEKHDAEIIILHVIDEVSPTAHGFIKMILPERDIERIKGEAIEEMNTRLDEFCKRELREKPQCLKRIKAVEVREGYPAEEILKIADERECDVIIMGTHGKGLLTHTFLGSVAERVLRRSRKPVFIIPLPKE